MYVFEGDIKVLSGMKHVGCDNQIIGSVSKPCCKTSLSISKTLYFMREA